MPPPPDANAYQNKNNSLCSFAWVEPIINFIFIISATCLVHRIPVPHPLLALHRDMQVIILKCIILDEQFIGLSSFFPLLPSLTQFVIFISDSTKVENSPEINKENFSQKLAYLLKYLLN